MVFGWLFKTTATRANKAMAKVIELENRMDAMQPKFDELVKSTHAIDVKLGKIESDNEHSKESLGEIKALIMAQK